MTDVRRVVTPSGYGCSSRSHALSVSAASERETRPAPWMRSRTIGTAATSARTNSSAACPEADGRHVRIGRSRAASARPRAWRDVRAKCAEVADELVRRRSQQLPAALCDVGAAIAARNRRRNRQRDEVLRPAAPACTAPDIGATRRSTNRRAKRRAGASSPSTRSTRASAFWRRGAQRELEVGLVEHHAHVVRRGGASARGASGTRECSRREGRTPSARTARESSWDADHLGPAARRSPAGRAGRRYRRASRARRRRLRPPPDSPRARRHGPGGQTTVTLVARGRERGGDLRGVVAHAAAVWRVLAGEDRPVRHRSRSRAMRADADAASRGRLEALTGPRATSGATLRARCCPIRSRSTGIAEQRRRSRARGLASPAPGSTSRPFTPSVSHSLIPPTSNATAGRPSAAASRPTSPKGSGHRLGTATSSARPYTRARSSCATHPVSSS